MNTPTNIKEAKELIIRYNYITVLEINKIIKKHNIKHVGSKLANILTGYGNPNTCTLCKCINENCKLCIYIELKGCSHNNNSITFNNIHLANTSKELKAAFRARAKHIQSILDKL